jgi:5-formyltetrahydrofolate cyclo-ligase
VPSLGSTDPLAIRAQKQALRAELRARRRACAPACGSPQAAELGEQLADVLEQVISWSSVHTTAVYASVGHELDTAPLCRRLRQRSIRTCYPRVESKQPPKLSFIAVEDEQELVAAPFGLREPAAAATPLPLSAIDVFIVPGLGFDRDGQRLGQGLAFYDGILRQHPDALRVGVCHPFQQLSAVPHEPHDQGMDLVVTPTGYLVAMTRTRHRLQRVVDLKRPGVAPGLVDSETVSQPLEVKP